MGKVWLDGKLLNSDEAKISVFDHGLLYGDGCFEGIRVYNGRVFKLAAHLDRMTKSAATIRLPPPYTTKEIEKAIRDTLAANEMTDAYIRLMRASSIVSTQSSQRRLYPGRPRLEVRPDSPK